MDFKNRIHVAIPSWLNIETLSEKKSLCAVAFGLDLLYHYAILCAVSSFLQARQQWSEIFYGNHLMRRKTSASHSISIHLGLI